MSRRKIDWGWGGCVFLTAAIILSVMTLVMGGVVSRGGKFIAMPAIGALVIFLVFGFIGVVFLIVWFFSRRTNHAKEGEARWRGSIRRPPGT